MISFKDNFSKQSQIYLKYRPTYPKTLFEFLSSLTENHELAWDCGTGNGQAAVGLSEFYDKIIATDPSNEQIKHAMVNDRITYLVEKAEQTSLQAHTVDLISVANALHWFDFDSFYNEARRVLKQNGVLAAWAYGVTRISPEIDALINEFHDQTLNDYWLAENRLVENEYSGIPFPFQAISTPEFYATKTMNRDDLIGYLNTWSATQRYITTNNLNPTLELENRLMEIWKDGTAEKSVRWKLILKVGRVN